MKSEGNQQVMTIVSSDPLSGSAPTDGATASPGSSRIVSVDPATGTENGSVTSATSQDVADAVAADLAPLPSVCRTAPVARAGALRAAAADLRADSDHFAALQVRDTGRLICDAQGA